MNVMLPYSLAEHLLRMAESTKPHEACGLLLGSKKSAEVRVQDCIFSKNVTGGDSCIGFEIDPVLHLALQKQARASGKEIIGVWHSHPTSLAIPSKEDQLRSLERGWLWLITGWEEEAWKTKAFWAGFNDPARFTATAILTV